MGHWSRQQDDRGATLVEFALILPVLVMLLFGMVTGGLAYNRGLAMSHTSDQATRFAATLPQLDGIPAYLAKVHAFIDESSEGELKTGVPEREICVAWISGTSAQRAVRGVASDALVSGNVDCEGKVPTPADEFLGDRVQVRLARGDTIDLVMHAFPITIERSVTARYELTPSS